MKNRFQQYISELFIQPYDGTQGRMTNQLIYSQLKNRLKMMTQRPSSFISRLKYGGVIPLLLLAIIVFSFRDKGQMEMIDSAKITTSSDISLGAFNIPPG